jgi:hypothetical protein
MRVMRIFVTELLRFILMFPPLLLISMIRRVVYLVFRRDSVFLGFGPVPINLNHAKAVRHVGGLAESFSTHTYSIGGEIDVKIFTSKRLVNFLIRFFCIPYIFSIFRYTHHVFYFDGGALGHGSIFSWRFESLLLRCAGVKSIITAYGSDVHSTRQIRNLELKQGYNTDYPDQWRRNRQIESKIKYWSKNGDFILAGCDWVEYLPKWDKLVPSHFAIDTECELHLNPKKEFASFRVLHAPNHRNLKGSKSVEEAVSILKSEGLNIDLTLLSGVSNTQVLHELGEHDLVIDQLVIGWYAQFAIESLARGIPTICFISPEFKNLYSNLYPNGFFELPFIEANTSNIVEVLRNCYLNRSNLQAVSIRGRAFVHTFHSFDHIGNMFVDIAKSVCK